MPLDQINFDLKNKYITCVFFLKQLIFMKWAHKKDCIADCNYDIRKYILHNGYYPLTKKYKEDPHHFLVKFRIKFFIIALPTIFIVLILAALAIYFLYAYNTYNINDDQIYAIICWVLFFVVGMTIMIALLAWLASLANYFISTFLQLIREGYLNPNLNNYPYLMQELLFYYRKNPNYDFNNYWIVTTDYLYYSFVVFFHKLNEYYLENEHHH